MIPPESERRARPGRANFGPELLVLGGGAVYALVGRGRWANLTEDHGFWFSAAQSLLSGGRAMQEVRLQYGPVSLWILEGACRIFGPSVATLVVLQLLIGVGAVAGVQLFARRFLGPPERWLCAAILVPLILWMSGPGNLLYPCAFAMSHGLFLLMATLLASAALRCRRAGAAMAVAGALGAVTFLTKQEFGVAAVAGIAALMLLDREPGLRTRVARLAFAAGGFVLVYFGILDFARHGDSFRHLFAANILWPWASVPGPWQALYRRTLGLDDPLARVVEAADSLLSVFVFGGTGLLALYVRRLGRRRALAVAAALSAGWVVWAWRWTEGSHFRPMQLVLPGIAASIGMVLWQRRAASGVLRGPIPSAGSASLLDPRPQFAFPRDLEDQPAPARWPRAARPRDLGSFLAVTAGAVILLQREGYRGSIDAYYSGMGYVLAIPVVVSLLWFLIRGPRNAVWQPVVVVALALAELASFGRGRLRALESEWRKTVPYSTARGTAHLTGVSAPALVATARFLDGNSRPGDAILVLPNTYGLDFLLDRRNLSFFPWVSPGFLTASGERDLIRRCEASPPKAVVVFEKSFGVLRSGDFGAGFAEDLVAWLNSRYPRQERFAFPDGRQGRRLLPASQGAS